MRRVKRTHPLFQIWRGMIRRCHDPRVKNYKNYGGRGISVCDQWFDFWTFVADMPPRPSLKHTIDRKKNDGNYEPENVRWATKSEQMHNTRFNRRLTAGGKTQIAEDWHRERRLPKNTLFNRVKRGWSDEDAVLKPRQPKAPDHTVFPPGGYALCKQHGINPETVKSRLRRGWTFEEALSIPIKHEHGRSRVC
jgi:hypothetical protein